jgi:hypothetical protein
MQKLREVLRLHSPARRAHYERQATSGNGLSRLSGHYPVGGKVVRASRGSGSGTGVAHGGVPLQERRIDLEELTRPSSTELTAVGCHATA